MSIFQQLYSVNQEPGTETLRTKFQPHVFLSEGKVGYIMFSANLSKIGKTRADKYVAAGHHVGFLTDTSDAAHAYAVPNNDFRAWLRAQATPIDTLQKMIDATGTLDANSQSIGGTLIDCNAHYFRNLGLLYLYSNDLTGSIPAELGNLTNLTQLHLSTNDLTGSIPAELGNLTNLQRLYLDTNDLTGSIPAELGNLTNMQYLYLSTNDLTGSIPAELGNLTNLTQLYLHDNDLTGSIPAELGNLTNLQRLYLYSNDLTGSIPAELGNLTNLGRLLLYDNDLTSYQTGAISTGQTVLDDILLHDNGTAETAFPVADINQICEDVLASVVAANRTGTLNLSGTNMSQPDGAGLAAAQTLVTTHGWTVTLKDGVLT